MANFGYTVAAYSVLWVIVLAFIGITFAKVMNLQHGLKELEAALKGSKEGSLAMPSAAHIVFIPGVLLVGMVLGYVLGARAMRAEVARRRARRKE